MSELIQSLQQKMGLSGDQASGAITHVLDYFKSKLPESLHEHLNAAASGTDLTQELKNQKQKASSPPITSKFKM